jgi:glycosyltransferase involved in cell wall biosynthesis
LKIHTTLSFLIPAYNEEKFVGECISSINTSLKNTGLDFEIIVGNHGSTDSTEKIALKRGAVVIAAEGRYVASVRNSIRKHARGSILIFLDADTTLAPDWGNNFKIFLINRKNSLPDISGSFCSPPLSKNFFIRHWFNHLYQQSSEKTPNYLGTAHIIVLKDAFDSLNGFDSNLPTGEDYEFCQRAKKNKYTFEIIPELKVYHHDYPANLYNFLKREAWHSSGDTQSIALILKSKIAILTILFLMAHLAILIFKNEYIFTASLVLIISIVSTASFYKFKNLSIKERLSTILIYHFYFSGRSWGILISIYERIFNSRRNPINLAD